MCLWGLCLFLSQVHVWEYLRSMCARDCVSDARACVRMCAHSVRSASVAASILLPQNMSGVRSHRSPHSSLGHGVLCPLIGRFLGVRPRLLAVLWSLERNCAVGRLWDKLSPRLGSLPLPFTDTRHLKGSQYSQSILFLS